MPPVHQLLQICVSVISIKYLHDISKHLAIIKEHITQQVSSKFVRKENL